MPDQIAQLSNPNFKGAPEYTGAWKQCAYDPEMPGPLHTADQIGVPPSLSEVVRNYTKAAIREQPANMIEWSAAWFRDAAAKQKASS